MAVAIGMMRVTCYISYAAEVPVTMFQETTAQNIQDSSEYKKGNIKVKAEVTEGFSDKIQISYLGMNGNEFSVVLSPENKYTSCISVVQDYYTDISLKFSFRKMSLSYKILNWIYEYNYSLTLIILRYEL